MAARCSAWRKAEHHLSSGALVSRCADGVELQVRPLDHVRSPQGATSYVVRINGGVVKHGTARTLTAAKRAARRLI